MNRIHQLVSEYNPPVELSQIVKCPKCGRSHIAFPQTAIKNNLPVAVHEAFCATDQILISVDDLSGAETHRWLGFLLGAAS